MTEDTELLCRFARERSESAFTELVQRKAGLVYSAALRQLDGDELLAQDVSQTVFIDLARKAPSLLDRPVLSSWLYRSTRFAALKARRSRQRRQAREQETQIMENLCQESARDAEWARLRPLIDQAICELSETDRAAVLLRYFEGYAFPEIAKKTGLAESAARMRTERALDKLRRILGRLGVHSTTAALGLVLANQAVTAAPAGLPAVLAGHALAKSMLAGGAGLTLKWLSLAAMKKLSLTVAALFALVATGVAYREPAAHSGLTAYFIFTVCFGTGLLFALVSLVAGHLFETHAEFSHGGTSHPGGGHPGAHGGGGSGLSAMPGFAPLGPTTIATFITAFGGLGMIFVRIEPLHRYSGFLAAWGAATIAGGVSLFFSALFRNLQGSSEGHVADLIGLEATVITPIPRGGVGEIAYVQSGSRYSAPARSEDRLLVGAGTTVRIARIVGTQFYVQPV